MSKSFKRMMFWLSVKLIPRRVLCFFTTLNRHRYGEPEPVIIDGPINLPPVDRVWTVLAFHRQCSRCYKIKSVGYTFAQAEQAVREGIEEDAW